MKFRKSIFNKSKQKWGSWCGIHLIVSYTEEFWAGLKMLMGWRRLKLSTRIREETEWTELRLRLSRLRELIKLEHCSVPAHFRFNTTDGNAIEIVMVAFSKVQKTKHTFTIEIPVKSERKRPSNEEVTSINVNPDFGRFFFQNHWYLVTRIAKSVR